MPKWTQPDSEGGDANRFVIRAVYEFGYSTVGYDRDREPIPRLLNITAPGCTRLHLMRYVYSKWPREWHRDHTFPAKFNLMLDFVDNVLIFSGKLHGTVSDGNRPIRKEVVDCKVKKTFN